MESASATADPDC